jgi:hypothetical protein
MYGPSKVTVEGVPFGLPAGTSLMLGDTPDFQKGVSSLPVQTQAELRRATELSRSGSLKAAYDIYEAIVMLFPDCDTGGVGVKLILYLKWIRLRMPSRAA